jgi:branched-chain amino acid transport system ATP-binding protein
MVGVWISNFGGCFDLGGDICPKRDYGVFQKMILQIKGLKKSFDGFVALRGVDLTLKEGEIKAIIGPNGAGKTTLLNLITGELQPTEGKIIFKGKDITGQKAHLIALLGIAKTFQIVSLFSELSASENIMGAVQARKGLLRLRYPPYVVEKTQEIIDVIGLREPERLAGELSYGEQKLLEIGIALACEPKLLLLDEPTAGLSKKAADEIIEVIKKLQDKSIIIVEHDMDVVEELTDSVVVLHQGRVIAESTPQQVRENPTVQEVYLGHEDLEVRGR